MSDKPKIFYLRKHGTDEVFARTEILAKRPDMKPITEKEAKRLMEKVNKDHQEAAANRMAAKSQVAAEKAAKELEDAEAAKKEAAAKAKEDKDSGPNYKKMKKDELRTLAAERKVMVDDDATKPVIIAALEAADGEEPEEPEEGESTEPTE